MVTETLRQACKILRWGKEEIIEDEKLSRLNEIVFVMLGLVENMPISS